MDSHERSMSDRNGYSVVEGVKINPLRNVKNSPLILFFSRNFRINYFLFVYSFPQYCRELWSGLWLVTGMLLFMTVQLDLRFSICRGSALLLI